MKTNNKSNQKLQTAGIALLNLVFFFSASEKTAAQNDAAIIGIDHVGINVPDLNKAVDFFTNVLGFTPVTQLGPIPLDEVWKERNHMNPATGAVTIKMINAGTGASIEVFEYADNKGSIVNPNSDDIGASHIAFYTTDIQAGVNYLQSKGVKVLGEPFLMPSGDTAGESWVYFETPWGSKMELVSYPNGKGYEKLNPKTVLWSPKNQVSTLSLRKEIADPLKYNAIVERHFEIWNGTDEPKRIAAMNDIYASDIEVLDNHFSAIGNNEINKFVNGLHKKYPGYKFTVKSLEMHHNIIRVYWQNGPKAKPDTVTGMDLFVLENGKVQKLYVFVDAK
jgi:catechol 2,3-dioxygenase-like lactoylglutathione lyase family enzyme